MWYGNNWFHARLDHEQQPRAPGDSHPNDVIAHTQFVNSFDRPLRRVISFPSTGSRHYIACEPHYNMDVERVKSFELRTVVDIKHGADLPVIAVQFRGGASAAAAVFQGAPRYSA